MVDVLGTASAVLALVEGAGKGVKMIVTFIKGVRGVDETVAKFILEAENSLSTFRANIDLIEKVPDDLRERRELEEAWIPMRKTLMRCKMTAIELTELFEKLNESTRSGAVWSAIKQINLQLQESKIATLQKEMLSLQIHFQTAIAGMQWGLSVIAFKHEKLGRYALQRSIINLEDKIDILTQFMIASREDQTNSQEIEPGWREMQKSMHQAMREMYKSADKTFIVLSTAGTEHGDDEDLNGWMETLSDAEVPDKEEDIGPMDPISWAAQDITTSTPRSYEAISFENMEVRSGLITKGIAAYHRCDYFEAFNSFRGAYRMGPVNTIPSPDGRVEDDTLKAWLWLAEIRVNSRLPKRANNRVSSGLIAPKVNPAAVRIETRIQIFVDACLVSLAFMHNGDVDRAHDLCQAAQNGAERMKETNPKEYSEAVLTLVEILYSKGSVSIAKSWEEKLSKNHREILETRAANFFLPRFKHNKSGLDSFQKLKRPNIESASSQVSLFMSNVPGLLYEAIDQGNFCAALFVVTSTESSSLTAPFGNRKNYVTYAMKSYSISVVSLMLQLELESISTSGIRFGSSFSDPPTRQMVLDEALEEAVWADFAAAIGLLIDAGANKERNTYTGQNDSHEEDCYSLDPYDTDSQMLAMAVTLGHSAAVYALLAKGAAVNLPDGLEPPLHVAIRSFDGRQFIALLLEKDANVNCSFRGVKPLGLAIYHSGKRPKNRSVSSNNERDVSRDIVVKHLIEKGADVNRRSIIENVKLTPLQQARKYRLSAVERLLLDNGAEDVKWRKQNR